MSSQILADRDVNAEMNTGNSKVTDVKEKADVKTMEYHR